jgi:TonB family protein
MNKIFPLQRDRDMRMRCCLILALILPLCLGSVAAQAQTSTESGRQVLKRTIPVYPEFARKMSVAGTVKLFAIVAPDGKVKSVETLGGSPVFLQAAKDAISQWKFAPATAETKELIELHFNPQ